MYTRTNCRIYFFFLLVSGATYTARYMSPTILTRIREMLMISRKQQAGLRRVADGCLQTVWYSPAYCRSAFTYVHVGCTQWMDSALSRVRHIRKSCSRFGLPRSEYVDISWGLKLPRIWALHIIIDRRPSFLSLWMNGLCDPELEMSKRAIHVGPKQLWNRLALLWVTV